jgi:formate/nitrite transporter FocA (FNT family)
LDNLSNFCQEQQPKKNYWHLIIGGILGGGLIIGLVVWLVMRNKKSN